MKLSQNDLFCLSLSDLIDMMEGHNLDVRETYMASRLGAYLSTLVHLSKEGQQSLTPQKMFKFDWEQDIKKSVEDVKQTQDHFRKLGDIVRQGKLKPKVKNNVKSNH